MQKDTGFSIGKAQLCDIQTLNIDNRLSDNLIIDPCMLEGEFFRIHPMRQVYLNINKADKNWYALSSQLADEYDEIANIVTATLFQGVTEQGESFILPLLDIDISDCACGEMECDTCRDLVSLHSKRDDVSLAIEKAKKEWVKIAGCEDAIYVMDSKKIKKNQLNWPYQDFEATLKLAFYGNFFIESADHPKFKEILCDRRINYDANEFYYFVSGETMMYPDLATINTSFF